MLINIFKQKSKSKKYNWVLNHLKSDVHLKPDPYLWTRIEAQLNSVSVEQDSVPGILSRINYTLRWALPLILIFTISFGVLVGFELSNNFRTFKKETYSIIPHNDNHYDMDGVMETNSKENLPPLQFEKRNK